MALRNPSLAEKVLITAVDGSVGVSQTAPGSISTDKPSGSWDKSWDFVLGALSPSLCLQNVTPGQCLCALCHPVISLLCPHSSLCHSSVLWSARLNLLMSLVCHLSPPSTNLQLPTPFSCHFTALLFSLFKSQQSKAERKALGSKLVTKINVKTSIFVGWNYTGNAISCCFNSDQKLKLQPCSH